MKILYDSNIFLSYKAGGIARYHYELYKGITNNSHHEIKMAGKFIKNDYLRYDPQFRNKFIYDPSASFAWLNRYLVKRALKNSDSFDLFHPSAPNYYQVSDIPAECKVVFTIHDLILERESIDAGKKKLELANRADKLIAVSQATKNDIIELFGIPGDKIEVIYHGSSLFPEQADLIKIKPEGLPEEYLLYVGNRNGYKNFNGFINGVAPLLKKRSSLHLVCAGKKAFSQEEQELFRSLGIDSKVVSYSGIDDNLLAYLYCHAKAFVFPSLNEGFGIPILEAWSCGTPVILSENPCFREVAAEAGFYFNPTDPDSIFENIEKVVTDSNLQKELIEKGKKRLKLFSWENTVRQTIRLYESLLS
ncbi:glycosyltransferase family 4 protein [Parabacteroides sp. FAFU027]|uniref:glycosyltransferase family 4 protein n=1 Tax=Parabacteroides sp. FAFU027 TaxID=2922715 RepID=UPI001FAEF2B5|nr:glycosyltransferase family 1 protein [Parabacteroides sp. FAFU027]